MYQVGDRVVFKEKDTRWQSWSATVIQVFGEKHIRIAVDMVDGFPADLVTVWCDEVEPYAWPTNIQPKAELCLKP